MSVSQERDKFIRIFERFLRRNNIMEEFKQAIARKYLHSSVSYDDYMRLCDRETMLRGINHNPSEAWAIADAKFNRYILKTTKK